METSARLLNTLIRACGGAALALGLAFWLGYGRSLTQAHIGFGIGLVGALWALAGIAWTKNTNARGLAVFAALWGLINWIFGLTQNQILPGSFHWTVEISHLVTGAVAIALGGKLATAVTSRPVAST
jgi:hypothetical protein